MDGRDLRAETIARLYEEAILELTKKERKGAGEVAG